ncbi:response regulator receiver protein [Fibrisoma limi BUZ 3]|uniref:Response regulator receiver protein n=1 Tax=Fibrisoma limi BUZ 3 TaxID=1185876 RepID=I2GRN4_9BACT|nr:response regulator [Fibrisoma limi]CCH56562.1 response regulator receiver protein [Fibrisoma limi BUZ 3]
MALQPGKLYEVVVVDDDEDEHILFREAARQYSTQINILFFTNGATFISHLQANNDRPNLVILDVHIPILNGYELLMALKQEETTKDIPVVVWSGVLLPQEISRCYKLGANSVVVKPDTYPLLVQSVGNLCRYWFDTVALPSI